MLQEMLFQMKNSWKLNLFDSWLNVCRHLTENICLKISWKVFGLIYLCPVVKVVVGPWQTFLLDWHHLSMVDFPFEPPFWLLSYPVSTILPFFSNLIDFNVFLRKICKMRAFVIVFVAAFPDCCTRLMYWKRSKSPSLRLESHLSKFYLQILDLCRPLERRSGAERRSERSLQHLERYRSGAPIFWPERSLERRSEICRSNRWSGAPEIRKN